MAERKVQSKHIPADFDHRVLKHLKKQEPKKRKPGGGGAAARETVRLMLPFNVCCAKCNSYMYRGRKFNAKKEVGSQSNDYLGTKQLFFHIKCEHCSSPIVFRTDPASSGFAMVSGARENKTSEGRFNPLANVVEKEEEEEMNAERDAMAALEARALETRQEMEKINELTREMQRSAQREQNFKRGIVLKDEEEDSDVAEEEEELVNAFLQTRREQALGMNSLPAATAATAATELPAPEEEGEEEEDVVVFQKRKRVKSTEAAKAAAAKAPMSFVAYDSDDSE